MNLAANRITVVDGISMVTIPRIQFGPAEEFICVAARAVKSATQQRARGDRAQAEDPQRAVARYGAAKKA